jgi:hypothetical protein
MICKFEIRKSKSETNPNLEIEGFVGVMSHEDLTRLTLKKPIVLG